MRAPVKVAAWMLFALLFTTTALHCAKSNDTEAAIGAGGLVFKTNPYITIRSEDLFISTENVIVRYEFFNRANDDIEITVAFPAPDQTSNFITYIDGQPATTLSTVAPLVKNKDVSRSLAEFQLPASPQEANEVLESLSNEQLSKLQTLGLVSEYNEPTWRLASIHYWTQRFPARRLLKVEHRYAPVTGGSVATSVSDIPTEASARNYYSKFCVDPPFIRAVQKRKAAFREQYIEYILTTGANWSGPIERFRLVVDKGSRRNLVSFCAKGVKRLSSTRFEVVKRNFNPTRDLHILVLRPKSRKGNEGAIRTKDAYRRHSCKDLWLARNQVFKDAGYCFKTARAIRAFGNAGCQFDNPASLAFSDLQRKKITALRSLERKKKCLR